MPIFGREPCIDVFTDFLTLLIDSICGIKRHDAAPLGPRTDALVSGAIEVDFLKKIGKALKSVAKIAAPIALGAVTGGAGLAVGLKGMAMSKLKGIGLSKLKSAAMSKVKGMASNLGKRAMSSIGGKLKGSLGKLGNSLGAKLKGSLSKLGSTLKDKVRPHLFCYLLAVFLSMRFCRR